MTRLDWEKARRRDRTKKAEAAAKARSRTRLRGGHSNRKPSNSQVSYAQHLHDRYDTSPPPDCCSRHLSYWIAGAKALAAEGHYSKGAAP